MSSGRCEVDIFEAVAKALWADAWSSWADENPDDAGSLSGVEIFDVLPPTPEPYTREAYRLVGAVEYRNSLDIHALHAGTPEYPDPENFGHYLAMQAMGHGVGLWEESESWGYRRKWDTPSWETEPYYG